MRALQPSHAGVVDRAGVAVAYEVFGGAGPDRNGPASPTIVFAPIDPIVNSRTWKAQVPYLARYARVVTIDPRGNGRSDRSVDPSDFRRRALRGRHVETDGAERAARLLAQLV